MNEYEFYAWVKNTEFGYLTGRKCWVEAHAIDNSWREGEVDWDMAKATAEMYLDDKDMGNQIIDSYPIDITENE
jgi:hypothetical protein